MNFQFALEMDLPREKIFPFFSDLERWFRLNPQWNVLSFEADRHPARGSRFVLKVEYDRSEVQVEYQGSVEEFRPDGLLTIRLEAEYSREITLSVVDGGPGSFLKYRETRSPEQGAFSDHERRELELWVGSVANYIRTSNNSNPFSRLWKWFVDRYWLKMSPSGRRTVFFVVWAEGLSLVFFLLILLWLLVFKRI